MQVSEITAFLEHAYDVLNREWFGGELPRVVITVQSTPRCFGHYTPWKSWANEKEEYNEINLGAETIDRELCRVIATLQHECCHHYCNINGIKDVSRGGTYHNKRFMFMPGRYVYLSHSAPALLRPKPAYLPILPNCLSYLSPI